MCIVNLMIKENNDTVGGSLFVYVFVRESGLNLSGTIYSLDTGVPIAVGRCRLRLATKSVRMFKVFDTTSGSGEPLRTR